MEPAYLQDSLVESNKNASQLRSALCEHCRAIFLQPNSLYLLISSKGLDHCRDRYSIVKSALDGCKLCRELLCMPWDVKFQKPGSQTMVPVRQRDTPSDWPLSHWESIIKERESQSSIMTKITRHLEQPLRFNWKGRNGYSVITLSRHEKFKGKKSLEVWMKMGSDNLDLACDRNYEKIRKWLVDCDTCHYRCRKSPSSMSRAMQSPSLILDVSFNLGPDRIRLCRMGDSEVSYAALSYCWGAKQPNATLLSNISTYLSLGIDATLLPQTVQDAIIVTRKLGLQYLWVDSMCIIQDSDDDKMHEIGKMSQIYSNAYVTINASRSKTCNDGFLRTRNQNLIEIPFCKEDNPTVLAIIEVQHPRFRDYDLEPEPINSRAWTFQESFMSRRMIIYSQRQIFWCCGVEWGKDGGTVSRMEYFRQANTGVSGGAVEVSRYSSERATLGQWQTIVEIYSFRRLGDPMDKLPALSCLASFFAERLNAQYLAGLWSSAIPRFLCWQVETVGKVRRPKTWRSPSWSFFSVDGGLTFRHISKENWCIEVVWCETTPVSMEAPFGQISSASLVIRGSLFPLRPAERGEGLSVGDFKEWIFDSPKNGTPSNGKSGWTIYEIETNYGNITQDQPLWAFPLAQVSQIYETQVGPSYAPLQVPWGIILACLPNGQYHRVGYFEMAYESWVGIKRVQEEIIIIV